MQATALSSYQISIVIVPIENRSLGFIVYSMRKRLNVYRKSVPFKNCHQEAWIAALQQMQIRPV